jgi:hypothetical protein
MQEGQNKERLLSVMESLSDKAGLVNDNYKTHPLVNDKVVGQIYSTTDYSKFRLVFGNRQLKRSKVIRMREAIKLDNKIKAYPIIVNSSYQIIDGQHRFIALAELGLPVCYIVSNTFKISVIAKNASNQDKWKSDDYLESWCVLGRKDYIVFRNFMKTYDTNFTVTLVLFNGRFTGGLYRDFAEGKFSAKHHKRAIKWIEMVQDFKSYIQDIHKDRHFVRAILNCFGHPEYNHKRMLRKMKLQGSSMIKKQMNRLDYIRQIEALYNWHENESNQIRFF